MRVPNSRIQSHVPCPIDYQPLISHLLFIPTQNRLSTFVEPRRKVLSVIRKKENERNG
jgi:hypothetical protein